MATFGHQIDSIKVPEDLFDKVKFFTIGRIEDEVERLLTEGGAKKDGYLSHLVTHAICDDTSHIEYSETRDLFDEIPIVTSRWVTLSTVCKTKLPLEGFNPETTTLFKGILASSILLRENDTKSVWGMLVAYGGNFSPVFNSQVTHLIATKPSGIQYEEALKQGVKIVTPDWVADCVLQKKRLGEERYHPKLLILEQAKLTSNIVVTPNTSQDTRNLPAACPFGSPMTSNTSHAPVTPNTFAVVRPQMGVPGARGRFPHPHNLQHQQEIFRQGFHIPPFRQQPPNFPTQQTLNKMVNQRLVLGIGRMPGQPNMPEIPPELMANIPLEMLAAHRQKIINMNQQAIIKQHPNVNPLNPMAGLHSMQQAQIAHEAPLAATMVSTTPRTNSPRSPRSPRGGTHGGSPRAGSQGSSPKGNSPRGVNQGARGTSPRNTVRNVANSNQNSDSQQDKGLETKIQQIMDSISRASPRPMTPSRNNGQGKALQDLTYYGHDAADSIPGDLCLLGCVFYIADYSKNLKHDELDNWRKVIDHYGGQIDNAYSNRVTHLLCENQKTDVFQLALRDQKRAVTANWLNDVLIKKKMLSPWLPTHFPSTFGDKKPCSHLILCQSNFDGEERKLVKRMIETIGAKYTGYMTRDNSALICKSLEGVKNLKAREWNLPIVNVQWLSDLVLGDIDSLKLPVKPQHQDFNCDDPFKLEIWKVAHLMNGWKIPLKVHKDIWKRHQSRINQLMVHQQEMQAIDGAGGKRKPLEPVTEGVNKRSRINQPIPGLPCVMFTGIHQDSVTHLTEIVYILGGSVADVCSQCTHLVTPSIQRTIKFLTCLSTCQCIVRPEWLEACAARRRFIDEQEFGVLDERSEQQFNFKLSTSLYQAHTTPLFKGISVYITPTTSPGHANLKAMLESAGGTVLKKLPSVRQVLASIGSQGQPRCVVVTCSHDLHICKYLLVRNIAVYNAEFIMTNIIRQEIVYNDHQLQGGQTLQTEEM